MINYKEWESLKTGDRVKHFDKKGTIISAAGVGYVVQWDDGEKQKVQDGFLEKVK